MDVAEGTGASTWLKQRSEDEREYEGTKYSPRTRVIIIVIGSLLSWGAVLLPIVAFGNEYLLTGTEFGAEYLSRFQKWNGVLQRHRAEPTTTGRPCSGGVERVCAGPTWSAFLDSIETDALSEQLIQVNRYVNETPYMQDAANWGESDHWAAPAEFFAQGGDCEDYAIAKYFSLRKLGVPPEQLRIVVLHDQQRRRTHAVLAVAWEGQTLVLDNLRNRILPWWELYHYLPIYSVNEQSAWLYTRTEYFVKQQPGG
jgi:predicted transglutaminase-like cysteine proteinase